MFPSQNKSIIWALVLSIAYTPSMVFALQQPSDEAKVDLGYVTPGAVAAAAAFPRRVLTAPESEMLPLEVITAWGMKELGFDPLEIEWMLAFVEMPDPETPQAGPPPAAVILRSAKQFPEGAILGTLWDNTQEEELDGKTYRKGHSPADPSIYRADDYTLIIATGDLLPRMLDNHAEPEDGRVTNVLERMKKMPDVMGLVFVEPVRPMLAMPLMMVPVPPQLGDVKQIPSLLTSIGLKGNLRGMPSYSLIFRANNEDDAQKLDDIIGKAMDFGKQMMDAKLAEEDNSDDPVKQAMAKYQKRVGEKMMKQFRPVRDGAKLTLTVGDGDNPQAASMATIGILVALLLPAVQAAREAARKMQEQNEQNGFPGENP